MGEVFRAYDRLTAQVVALKQVRLPLRPAPATQQLARSRTSLGEAATLGPEAPLAPQLSAVPGGAETVSGLQLQALRQEPEPRSLAPQLAATVAASPHLHGSPATPLVDVDSEPPPSPELQSLRLHLAQEFRTLAGLRHPYIVSVLDYGFDRSQQPYFTMELLEGGKTLDEAARNQPFAVQVGLLLQILQALTYLHRRGVLHRDLKPGNILVIPGPHGPQVKLLDFGLALSMFGLHSQRAEVAGTIGYIAPEVLVGSLPSEASDLFAVGVMAHELLVGTHPLGAQPTAALIRDFLGQTPIFSENARLGPALSSVLRRALCRAPNERYVDAAAFGQDLARVAGLPLPTETAEIRESFLQAATFVAREEELSTLRRALEDTVAGTGAIWLVGGESGVGKSRLLDELRTLALVRGTRVVRGQAVSAGGAAYQVWQGALRQLCLNETLDDADASVLRAVVPDIARLLGREVPEPPAVDPQNAQARFLWTVERLLLSQREPLVILLEDLHWAEPASLAVLQRLVRSVARYPLLIVGSYRQDERAMLLEEVPGARSLLLHRLSPQALALLSSSMLGEVGRRPEVVTLLERETEGNAFFLVEVVRTLAEEMGSLENVGSGRIPSKVAAGGVQAVLARRLGRVPDKSQPLLCAASVLGRELNLSVLRALPEDLGAQVEGFLAACASASVLEVSENRWRFAHDKLREAVLATLGADERKGWHLRIGEAIERTYASHLSPHMAALGYHFDEAGQPARALPYRLRAGDLATRSGAVHEAIRHLERAMELYAIVGCTKAERAHALGLLCRAYQGASKFHECVQVLEQMFADVGFPVPQTSSELFAGIAALAAEHIQFQFLTRAQKPLRTPLGEAWTGEVADAVLAAGEAISLTRTPAQLIFIYLAHALVAERLREPARIAPAHAVLAFCLLATPLSGLSTTYVEQARRLLAQSSARPLVAQAYVTMVDAIMHVVRGLWDQADQRLDEEGAVRQSMGDWRGEVFILIQRAAMELLSGRWERMRRTAVSLERIAQRADVAFLSGLAKLLLARLAMYEGQLDTAAALLREAEEHEARGNVSGLDVGVRTYGALCWAWQGDMAMARKSADAALSSLLAAMPFQYGLTDYLHALADFYFLACSMARNENEKAELHERLTQSLALLRRLAAIFPIARARALYWHGRYAALKGHVRIAEWLQRQALKVAERYQMPLDRALAHQAIAEVMEVRGNRRRVVEERRAARELFERLGARWYLTHFHLED